ncbi:PilZ domain-containing protein [Halobacteriovorax sp.]|uniref:PilZ domain-containing protein n=1 Tax=Halobacteriovorax sp. TaxID=2020862 RepID=UPI003AF1EDCE
MKKIIIADTLTDFREVDLNDLYVEALSGVVFSNQYAFDSGKGIWSHLSEHQIPDVVRKALQKSPTDFDCPETSPEGMAIIQKVEAPSTDQNELVAIISRLIKDEVGQLRDEMSVKVEAVETRIGDAIKNIPKPAAREIEDSGVDAGEYKKKFEALKVKYKNLSVENKLAKKNLSKVIAKAKALNAKLEVAERELEHFREYSLNATKKVKEETIEIIDESHEVDHPQEVAAPKINMISQDVLISNGEVDETDASEEVTGEFDISSGGLEMATSNRAQSDDDELESLNLEGLKSGKSYEISNKKTWLYDTGAGVVGPLRFDEMLEDLIKGNIKGDTLVKKKVGASWVPSRDCLELNTKAEKIFDDPQNPENNKYLIERTEYRVGLQEIVSFSIRGVQKEFKGYLTNLSLSGGFIEVTQFEDVFTQDSMGTIFISEGRFERAIAIDFTIMRTSAQKRPKGLGIRFEAVSDTVLEVIGECMLEILNNDDQNKSAA